MRGVVRATGYKTFEALHQLVIVKGFHQSGQDFETWRHTEAAFHTAQMFKWAAEATGAERDRWLETAGQRLAKTVAAARERPHTVRN
jgi:hypothetical protein